MDQISIQEVTIYRFVSNHQEEWFANADIALEVKVSPRTIRTYTKRFADLGLLDKRHIFPGDRFRFSAAGAAKNEAYIRRLEEAAEALCFSH